MAYTLREAYKTFAKRRGTHVAAITTIASSLFVLSLFALGTINLVKIMRELYPKMDMTVFLKDDIGLKERREIEELLESSGVVEQYQYISKETALQEFKSEMAESPELFEALDINPLPASFQVQIHTPYQQSDDLLKLASELERMGGVDDVRYRGRLLERLQKIFSGAVLIDTILGISLCLAMIYVVSNTVGLLVYSRRNEVEIMKLVGATDSFIKKPFLIVGLIQGALGGTFAALLLYAFYLIVRARVSAVVFPGTMLIGGLIAFGALLGLLGSLVSVRKFLKT